MEVYNKTRFTIEPVNCDDVPVDTAPHFTLFEFPSFNKSAVIDYAPWSKGKNGKHVMTGGLYEQILNVEQNEAFIDVGANIGQMTLTGLVGGKITYAFDPLEYDMMKICAGAKESLNQHWMTSKAIDNLHLFRSLVGNENQANVSISRPDDSFGKFEQASLFPGTIGVARKPKKLVQEFVPMVRLDEIVPSDLPIGLVKIDVQGFEWPVVQGMKGLLERESGYPKIIHYEEQARITQGAGFKLGMVQSHLEEAYGYICRRLDRNDISCCRDISCDSLGMNKDSSPEEELKMSNGTIVKFCGSNKWKGLKTSCEERVAFLVNRYHQSYHEAKVSELEKSNDCICTDGAELNNEAPSSLLREKVSDVVVADKSEKPDNQQQPPNLPTDEVAVPDAILTKLPSLVTDHDSAVTDADFFCGECMWREIISCDKMISGMMKETSISREQAIEAVLPECSTTQQPAQYHYYVILILIGIFCMIYGAKTDHPSLKKPFIVLAGIAVLCFIQLQIVSKCGPL